MHHPDYRGSVVRVEYAASGELTADEGYLLLKGLSSHTWLKDIRTDNREPFLKIEPVLRKALFNTTKTVLYTPEG